MTPQQEKSMHQARMVTLKSAKDIIEFCKLNSIEVDTLTDFYLTYCRLPTMEECKFISKYGVSNLKLLNNNQSASSQKFELRPDLSHKIMTNATGNAMMTSLQIANFEPKRVFRSFESILSKWIDLENNFYDRVKENVERCTQPSVKVSFNESTEEIKRLMRATIFDIKYEFDNGVTGGWYEVSETEYIQNHNKQYGARIIYLDKEAKPETSKQ